MPSTSDWYTQNAGRTIWGRWMSGAPQQNEGGIDVPLPAGTPVYALASGPLMGYGNFWHPNGNPGYGVLTQQVNIPGLGLANLYYQHLDLAGNFQGCLNGNCGNQIVQQGQLIGYSRADPGEVEVGINPSWGGVWAGSTAPGPWITDPRPYLSALASGGGLPVTGSTPGSSTGLGSVTTVFLFVVLGLVVAYMGVKLMTGIDIGKPTRQAAEKIAKVAAVA